MNHLKKRLAILIFLFTLILSGCFSDPIQDDLLAYLNEELADISHLENEAVSAYEGATGANYTSDQILYDTLLGIVIPTYQEYSDKLEAIKVETDELRDIHEGYIEGVNLQLNAFIKIVTALEEADRSKIEEANEMLSDARKIMRDFNNDIEKLAEEHDVELREPIDQNAL